MKGDDVNRRRTSSGPSSIIRETEDEVSKSSYRDIGYTD